MNSEGPRRSAIFPAILLTVTAVIAICGALSMPPGTWARAVGNHQANVMSAIINAWVAIPGTFAFLLVSRLFMRGLFYPGRVMPLDHQRWGDQTLIVFGPYVVLGQAILTVGLLSYWNPTLKHLFGGNPHDPHVLGVADPHHLFPRLWVGVGASMLIWAGNSMPKLLTAIKSAEPERYDFVKMTRIVAWIFVLGGLGMVLCALFAPLGRTYAEVVEMLAAAMSVSSLAVWLSFKFGGHPPADAAPSKGA